MSRPKSCENNVEIIKPEVIYSSLCNSLTYDLATVSFSGFHLQIQVSHLGRCCSGHLGKNLVVPKCDFMHGCPTHSCTPPHATSFYCKLPETSLQQRTCSFFNLKIKVSLSSLLALTTLKNRLAKIPSI